MAQALCDFRPRAAQEARELVFGQAVRHRRHRAEYRCRIGAERDRDGKRLARMREAVIAIIERAATRAQPAHDDLVGSDHLLAINAEVLALFVRAARDHQAPRNQRGRVSRPAGLYRQAAEIDIGALPYLFLAGSVRYHPGRHAEHLLHERQFVPHIPPAARGFGFFQVCEQFADFA